MLKEVMQSKKIWAVVGSVHNKEKYAYKIYNFLKGNGYTVYALDPKGEDIDGDKSYKSIKDMPEVPEVLDMVINPMRAKEILLEAAELGIEYAWFQPGAESDELIELCEQKGIKCVHHKCVLKEFI